MTAPALFSPAWLEPRKPLLRAITIGNVSWLGACAAAFALWPEVTLKSGPAERLAFAAELAVAPAAVGLLVLASCLRLFDSERAEDPFAGGESRAWQINQRVLQNTLEQAFIFLPPLFALALRIDERQLRVLPIAVSLWCMGRLFFWVGYRKALIWRAPGFDWTLNTALLVISG